MKIGILGCGYQCEKDLEARLIGWFSMAKECDFVFSFVSCQFTEYRSAGIPYKNKETELKLTEYLSVNKIQHLFITRHALTEIEARQKALEPLLEEKCDLIFLLDLSDEYYTKQEIEKILNYVNREDNKFVTSFNVNFKNYIFDGKQWIDGFCPVRIYRTKIVNYRLYKFHEDNGCLYYNSIKDIVDYRQLANRSIPKSIVHIRHLTWLHSNGKLKVKYQNDRWGDCSYRWNEIEDKLEINHLFYQKRGLLPPLIYKD